jgi:hypothetical protein
VQAWQMTAPLLQLLRDDKTFEYPQVDDLLIEAVKPTLAPFAYPEKPQLFPRLAASFIKEGGGISGPRAVSTLRRVARGKSEEQRAIELWPYLLGFFVAAAQRQRQRLLRKPTTAAPIHDGMMLLIFTAGLTP